MLNDSGYSRARLPTFVSKKKMRKYLHIVRYGVSNLRQYQQTLKNNTQSIEDKFKNDLNFEDLDELFEEFADSLDIWQQIYPEIARIYSIDIDDYDLQYSSTDHNYIDSIKNRRFLKVKDSKTTYRLLTV